MERDVYQLKIVMSIDGEDVLTNFFIDMNKVDSFYVATDHEEFGAGVTIEYQGNTVTVQQEPHLLKYLKDNFINISTRGV